MGELETWREMIYLNDGDHLIAVAPDESVLDVQFDAGYGGTEGPDFLAWSETHVYFPVCYDGAESVGAAPRNPTSKGQPHVGGG